MPSGNRTAQTTAGVKEICYTAGCYNAESAAVTGTAFGGANCSAFSVLLGHDVKTVGDFVGLGFYNGSGGGSPAIGEGTGAGNSVNVYATAYASSAGISTKIPLYSSGSRTLTLASNTVGEMRLNGAIPLSNELLKTHCGWDLSAAGNNTPRHRTLRFLAGDSEDFEAYTNVTASVNTTSMQTSVDNGSYAIVNGNQALSASLSGATVVPTPAYLILRVPASQRHFAIIGTSRANSDRNCYVSPTLSDDGFAEMGINGAGKNYTYVNVSKSSSTLYQDILPREKSFRRWGWFNGVTDIILEHAQNDLAARTLQQFTDDLKTFNAYWSARGVRVWLCTCDPWVQKATTTGNAYDEYHASGHPLANATAETRRVNYNTALRSGVGATFSGTTNTVAQCCYGFFDTAAAVEDSTNVGHWKAGTLIYTGAVTNTPSAPSTTVFSDSNMNQAVRTLHDCLVRFTTGGTGTWGYLRSNGTTQTGRCNVASTASSTVLTWAGGTTPTVGQTLEIYKTQTRDGIHASYWGRVAKAAVISAAL